MDYFEPPKKKFKSCDTIIQCCINNLENNKITVWDFLNQVSNKNNNLIKIDLNKNVLLKLILIKSDEV